MSKVGRKEDRDRWQMSADVAVHWWFLVVALVCVAGVVIGRMAGRFTAAVFWIPPVGAIVGGIIFWFWARSRRRRK